MTCTYRKDGTLKTRTPDVRRIALASPTAHAIRKPRTATHTSTHAPSANWRQRSVTTDQSKSYWTSRKIIGVLEPMQGRPAHSSRPPPRCVDQTLTSSGSAPGPTPDVVRGY